jgi:hypothetical protein
VLTLAAAGTALAAAIVGMGMLVAMIVQMLVIVGMGMVMLMGMAMLMGMGNTVMGMLMGMLMGMGMAVLVMVGTAGNMIVMDMHCRFSFAFFLYYSGSRGVCQSIYFFRNIPCRGLRNRQQRSIMCKNMPIFKEVSLWLNSTATTIPIFTPMGLPIPTVMFTKTKKPLSTGLPGPSAIWKR